MRGCMSVGEHARECAGRLLASGVGNPSAAISKGRTFGEQGAGAMTVFCAFPRCETRGPPIVLKYKDTYPLQAWKEGVE